MKAALNIHERINAKAYFEANEAPILELYRIEKEKKNIFYLVGNSLLYHIQKSTLIKKAQRRYIKNIIRKY